MFASDLHGHEVPRDHRGATCTSRQTGRGSSGSNSEAQFFADCQAIVFIRATLDAEIRVIAAEGSYPGDNPSATTRVDQLEAKLQAYGRHIAAFPVVSDQALQCKRAVVGLLLEQQEDDPIPLCDTLLLSLLVDVECMSASPDLEGKPDGDAANLNLCLTQIEEVFAECVRVGKMPSSHEQDRLALQVFTQVEATRKLILELARMPAESALTIQAKGRVLQRLMCVGGADAHCQRLELARSLVADIAALGPPVTIEDDALRIGGHWWSSLVNRLWRPKGSSRPR